MDKVKYPTTAEQFINGTELVTELTPQYLHKASDDALHELRTRAEQALSYYSANGYPDMVRSLETVVADITMEANNRRYKSGLKEQEKAKNRRGAKTESSDGSIYEFGNVEEPKINKDDW